MPESPTTLAIPETIEDQSTGTGDDLEARVIVYNCNCHTYQQVITLFCEAIPGMTSARAFELAWRIDHVGSATVYAGEWKIAEGIAKHLAAGGLRVAIQ
ncbi:MAG: ATP-dependent Clp protease adaptor ClpS [Nitrospirae bacterium]|nr:ATP-dependent Clp protease adaptor ClpS [Nitrospirota bacterium]